MTVISNRLEAIIMDYESRIKTNFKPTRDFFKYIGIGHRRFYQLIRNEVSLTFSEMHSLANFFGVHILELHECTTKYISNEPTNSVSKEIPKQEKVDYKGRLGLVKS